jgi:DnaJ-class molecular chaperone
MDENDTKPCPVCNGTGHWLSNPKISCGACSGTGRVPK